MTRIVATYAAAGEGHKKASEAVAAVARGRPDIEVLLRDCLEGSEPWFRKTYTEGYLTLVQRAPAIWGGLFATTDFLARSYWLSQLRRWWNSRYERVFAEWLIAQHPDVIITTHFFPVEVVTALKQRGRLRTKLLCAITDWMPHTFWVGPGVDRYAVACEGTRQALIARGVPADRITITGIPIKAQFAAPLDRRATAQRLGFDPERFTVLIGSGGFGLGPVEALVKTLGHAEGSYHLVVVCGYNELLRRSVEAMRPHVRHPMTVYGFVDNMDELMAAAHVLISKPGGLTCSEAMARGLPMLIVAAIPGQEAYNSRILTAAGAAVRIRRLADLPAALALLRQPGVMEQMTAAARTLAQPAAAETVLTLAIELAHG